MDSSDISVQSSIWDASQVLRNIKKKPEAFRGIYGHEGQVALDSLRQKQRGKNREEKQALVMKHAEKLYGSKVQDYDFNGLSLSQQYALRPQEHPDVKKLDAELASIVDQMHQE